MPVPVAVNLCATTHPPEAALIYVAQNSSKSGLKAILGFTPELFPVSIYVPPQTSTLFPLNLKF